MNQDELLALANRIEKLTEPSLEIDEILLRWRGWSKFTGVVAANPNGRFDLYPRYTRSIVAAVALVPEDCLWGVKALWANADQPFGRKVYRGSVDRYEGLCGSFCSSNHLALAASEATALLAAALRAHAEALS